MTREDMSAAPKARQTVETYIVPDGTCFLFDPVSDASYTLDQVGALVWDYCDGQTPPDEIIREIAALLPDNAGIPSRVAGLLREFAEEGLLESSTLEFGAGMSGD